MAGGLSTRVKTKKPAATRQTRGGVVPAQVFAEVEEGEDGEDNERNNLLVTLSWTGEKRSAPMRLAGTWKQYSKKRCPS